MQWRRVSAAIVSLTVLFLARFASPQPPPLQLYFSFISSSVGGFVTSGAIPGVEIALEQIAKSDVLRGYELRYGTLDSKCDRTESLKVFFDAIQRRPVHVALLGCGCSIATEPVAEIIHNWNISLVSYSSSDPGLSDRRRFPSFFRTYTSDENAIPAIVALVQQYGWMRIGVLTEQENLFVESLDLLRRRLMGLKVRVESQVFEPDRLLNILRNNRSMDFFLQREDYRVLFLNMYSDSARIIICEAIRNENLANPRTWITYGWYQKEWFSAGDTDCTTEEFQMFLENTLVLESFPAAVDDNATTISNLTSSQFFDEYGKRIDNNASLNFTFVAPAAYDAVWAVALALNKTMQTIADADEAMEAQVCAGRPGSLVPLEEFEYTNQCLGNLITRNINQTSFEGITGSVKFSPEDGTRIQNEVRILQYRSTADGGFARVPIANTSVLTSNFSYLDSMNDSSVFPGGVVPDGTPINVTETYHLALVITYYILAAVGLAFTAVCLVFNLLFRDRKIIRLTSPNLNYFILGGAAIMYITIFFRLIPTTDGGVVEARCYIETWMVTLGYSLGFATILVKMARVYQIFHDPKPNKMSLKDWQLILAILVLVSVSVLLLILGSSIPKVRPNPTIEINAERPTGRDESGILINYHTWGCYDNEDSIPLLWVALIFVYFAILQLVALVLAIQTRKVTVKVLNDSKFIAAIIYITSIVLVVIALVTIFLSDYNNVYEVLFSGGVLLAATAILVLIFVPKMVSLYRDPKGKNIFSKSSNSTTLEVSQSGAFTLKVPSAETEREKRLLRRIEELEEQLRNSQDSGRHPPNAQNSSARKSGGLAPPTDTPPHPHNGMTNAL